MAILFIQSLYHNGVTEFNLGINVHLMTDIGAASGNNAALTSVLLPQFIILTGLR